MALEVEIVSGPPPKKSSERRRRNKDAVPVETRTAAAESLIIPPEDQHWHVEAKRVWRSLRHSPAVTASFQSTDWAFAHLTCEAISRMMNADKLSAQLLHEVSAMMGDLLMTEGARRRLRLELAKAKQGSGSVTPMDAYRDALGRSSS